MYIYSLTHRVSWETCVGRCQLLVSMLAVNLFHLHFVCLPPFRSLPYGTWAFGQPLWWFMGGNYFLGRPLAHFGGRVYENFCCPPKSMQQFTFSILPTPHRCLRIFHTWLLLLIWKAIFRVSTGHTTHSTDRRLMSLNWLWQSSKSAISR